MKAKAYSRQFTSSGIELQQPGLAQQKKTLPNQLWALL
jgi:hypothetical protein